MKKKIIAIALCLVTCIGAASLASCTAGTNGGAKETTATTTEKATEATTEKQTNAIEGAESIVGDITGGMRNRMGDPNFSDFPHRGVTPSGK